MRRITYIHQRPDWPHFRWDASLLTPKLAAVRHRQGRLLGAMQALGFQLQTEATLQTLTQDALKTSEIEGELLDRQQVRSSVARRMGLDTAGLPPVDRRADAIVAILLDATQNFDQPLTIERLFNWHATLFATANTRWDPITIGAWRTDARGPMIVASGPPDRERIHFKAPAASLVPAEMERLLAWLHSGADRLDPVLAAAIAHLWFVTIHPFDDGNGRIGRAIMDMLLARSEATGQRFYSMSARLRIDRTAYYDTLEQTQKAGMDITPWLSWFLQALDHALSDAEATLTAILRKARFWDSVATHPINPRQRRMLDRLLDGLEARLTTSKWAKMAKCSQDTALRDIAGLIQHRILVQDQPGGRSTSYSLATPKPPDAPARPPPA